jgi:hypothetical protein
VGGSAADRWYARIQDCNVSIKQYPRTHTKGKVFPPIGAVIAYGRVETSPHSFFGIRYANQWSALSRLFDRGRKCPRTLLNRSLGGPLNQCGSFGENVFALAVNRHTFPRLSIPKCSTDCTHINFIYVSGLVFIALRNVLRLRIEVWG